MGLFDLFSAGPSGAPKNAPDPSESHELVLYKFNSCPFCRRVLSVIDRLGLDVEMADIHADSAHRRALFEATGRTTVPCLFIDGQPLFESADIVAWLEAYKAGRSSGSDG